MSLFQNRMVSVRQILRKTRTRTIVAIVATSVLATVSIGAVVYKAIAHIQLGTNEIIAEAHEYELGREQFAKWSNDMQKQVDEIRDYLTNLQSDVRSSSAALDEICALYKDEYENDEDQASFAVSDVQSDMSVLQEKIETALSQIGLIDQTLSGEEGISEGVQNRANALMQELNSMMDSIKERYMLVQSEMDRLVVVLNQSGVKESAQMSRTIETLHAFAERESDELAEIKDQLARTKTDIEALQTMVNQVSTDQQTIISLLNTTVQMLTETGTLVSEGDSRYAELASQLEAHRSELDSLSASVVTNTSNIQTMGMTLDSQAGNINSMQQIIDGHSLQMNEIAGKVPFSFGIDPSGEYGYYKMGEEIVTPFYRPFYN